jgi:hypothetical protein
MHPYSRDTRSRTASAASTNGGAQRRRRQGTVHRPTASSYANNALQSGFSTDDIDTLSDQLVDALITWGDEDAIIRRIDQQFDAGADHIPLIVLTDDTEKFPMDQWRRLATAFDGRYR